MALRGRRLSISPSRFPTAASPAGCSDRWCCWSLVMSFSQYGGLLAERMFGQTGQHRCHRGVLGPQRDLGQPVRRPCSQQPITFITGFGWDVYWSLPFQFSPHNHYFSLWFNLGLVGCSAAATCCSPRSAARAAPAWWPSRRCAASSSPSCIGAHRACAAPCSSSTCTTPGSTSGCTPASSCAWCCASQPAPRRRRPGAASAAPGRVDAYGCDPYGWARTRGALMRHAGSASSVSIRTACCRARATCKYIGGETVQHVLLARAWRDLGHDVSMIVLDDGQGARRVVDGITAIAAHTRTAGIPGPAVLPSARHASCSRR